MTSAAASHFWIVATAFLWGATDPLLKHFGSRSIKPKEGGGLLSDLRALLTNWRYLAALTANQAGSATFLLALAGSDVTAAAPAANGLKFAFNWAAGRWLGEEALSPAAAAGVALIVTGAALQMSG